MKVRTPWYDSCIANVHDIDPYAEERLTTIAQTHETNSPAERALLVAVDWRHDDWDIASSLEELAQLAETAGLDVVGSITQALPHPNHAHYVGSGKLNEIKELRESLRYDVVLVDDELPPAQLRNLEEALEVKVIDRTALILDIFARRAQTHEGRLQVELAQLEYRLPRLTRMWTHLSRQAVGGVGLRGPGETQLEADRRQARQRIAFIKQQLDEVHRHRQLYRERRQKENIPIVALVGYTNAGKSTLLNTLAGASVLAEDKLFATLDPTTRRIELPGGHHVLVTDTVGFINKLPTLLIAAFRATLEEILEAAVLVHVLDVTHPKSAEQAETVRQVIEELGADDRPVITALNKIDRLNGALTPDQLAAELGLSPDYVPISAQTGNGLDLLLSRVEEVLASESRLVDVQVMVPYGEAGLVDLFHRKGQVRSEEFTETGAVLSGRIPQHMLPRFEPFRQTRAARAR
ncbi:GTPase HflX [Nitrolancea hollandica]|uniref:GTPase HflX n=1 Tax=Nitrolancea hollandica Lb TaxID=1129897 RepID=I4ECB7_9BACT|nr:GTPase HflX [Nitrolancea hollandica]CCF82329.1 putative GTP-binding protein ynbA [Nitrolancea hollandica Lb]